jgi:hypothetical protein
MFVFIGIGQRSPLEKSLVQKPPECLNFIVNELVVSEVCISSVKQLILC